MKHILFTVQIVLLILLAFASPGRVSAIEGEFVPQELIVRFKQGHTPVELESQSADRTERGRTFLVGPFKLLLEDIKYRVTGSESPEKKYLRLQTANQSIGVTSIQAFNADDNAFTRYYILYLDGSVDVPAAISYYRNLPEIEFVEPNYIYSEVGI